MQDEVGEPSVKGHYGHGMFQPDPVVLHEPVLPTNIYVQVGAFTVEKNAYGLKDSLADVGRIEVSQANVSDRLFHRVRVGPLSSVQHADQVLEQLIYRGHTTARVVVD